MNLLMIGGGICGLGAALMLARDGHDVTLLERDDAPLPDSPPSAWDAWERKGVAQFRQPHNLMPGLRLLLESELPDVQDALARAGAAVFDMANPLPPFFSDRAPRPIDASLWTYTARRPVAEWVFARAAESQKGLTIRRGTRVAELLMGTAVLQGVPHVTGVRTTDGDALHADLVIDASGRASRNPDWLEAAGARRPYEEGQDCGFAYYTRYFRGTLPERHAGVLTHLGTFSLLTLPGDNGSWSVTVLAAAGDRPMKNARHESKWTALVRACPLHAHWLDGEPITDVLPMAGDIDRYRRFVVDDVPVATGFVAVADAWACTNPSAGRGLTVGFLHARELRDVLRETAGNPAELVQRFDARTETQVSPWYYAQIAVDRFRFAEMDALREGRQLPPPADDLGRGIMTLLAVMLADPDLFRAALEYFATVTPVQQILKRPDVSERMQAAFAAMNGAAPPPVPGPSRQQMLEILQ